MLHIGCWNCFNFAFYPRWMVGWRPRSARCAGSSCARTASPATSPFSPTAGPSPKEPSLPSYTTRAKRVSKARPLFSSLFSVVFATRFTFSVRQALSGRLERRLAEARRPASNGRISQERARALSRLSEGLSWPHSDLATYIERLGETPVRGEIVARVSRKESRLLFDHVY